MVKKLLSLLALLTCVSAHAGVPETITRIKPSIVAIATYQKLRSPALQIRGSGFVIGSGHTVATNLHVLPEHLETDEHVVLVVPGTPLRMVSADVEARDRRHDLALLRIASPLPALKLHAGDDVKEGQEILFTGFPLGAALGAVPVTHRGMISAITPMAIPGGNAEQINAAAIRQLRSGPLRVYQLDATAYPGNSGSPLLDADSGEVLGIINMVYVKGSKETALTKPSGISFAIPAHYLRELMKDESGR